MATTSFANGCGNGMAMSMRGAVAIDELPRLLENISSISITASRLIGLRWRDDKLRETVAANGMATSMRGRSRSTSFRAPLGNIFRNFDHRRVA